MPKAPVYEDHHTQAWKHDIGLTWQVPSMQAETQASPMKQLPHENLRFCILSSEPRHQGAASLSVKL